MKFIYMLIMMTPAISFAHDQCPNQILRQCVLERTTNQTVGGCGAHQDVVVEYIRFDGSNAIVLKKMIIAQDICPDQANQIATTSPVCF